MERVQIKVRFSDRMNLKHALISSSKGLQQMFELVNEFGTLNDEYKIVILDHYGDKSELHTHLMELGILIAEERLL